MNDGTSYTSKVENTTIDPTATSKSIGFIGENDPFLDMRWVSHFSDDYSLQDQDKMQADQSVFSQVLSLSRSDDKWDSYIPEPDRGNQQF